MTTLHDHPSFNSSLHSSHIWFSYHHNIIIILSQVYNEPIQQPSPSWLVSLIGRALHWYRRVKDSNPIQAWIFFRLPFCNCKSCAYNCHDHPSFNAKGRVTKQKSRTLFLMNSLPHRRNLTSFYSNICETVPISLFWAPNRLNELTEMFQIFPQTDWQIKNHSIFNRPITVPTQILLHRWKPRTRILLLFCRQTYPKG